jgi:O-methyltransferase involved in polyketide biosynthesis
LFSTASPRCQRREVHADLAGEWEPVLVDAGFDAARLTVWLAEGLFFYLTKDAVRRVLRTAARLCRARALFGADVFGTGLLRLPSIQPLIDQRRGSNQPLPFCTDQPGELLAACGWRTETLVHLGQPQANFGRLPDVPLIGMVDPTPRWAPTLSSVSDTTDRWLVRG